MKHKIVIVASKKDLASRNIGNKILELEDFKKVDVCPYETYQKDDNYLVWHDKGLVEEDVTDLDDYFDPELYIFVFRHLGKGQARLTVHPAGNFTLPKENSIYRGISHKLAYTNPAYMKEALKFMNNLAKERNLNYQVSYEVTHHTPTDLKKPVIFLEIGDTEENHNDIKAISIIAETTLYLLSLEPQPYVSCLAIGGSHYAERFTRRTLNENYGFGHFISSHAIEDIDESVINQAIDKTVGGVKFAMLDQKAQGSSEKRKVILDVLEKRGIEIIKLSK